MLHSCPQQSGTRPLLSSQCFESRRVTELANSTVWKRWVGATAGRMEAGHPQTVALGLLRGLGKAGLSLTEGATGMRTPGVMVQLFLGWRHHQPLPAGHRAMQREQTVQRWDQASALVTASVPAPKVKPPPVQPILQRLSPGTGPLPASSGHCRRLPPAGCPAAAPRCPAPAGTASPAGPAR